MKMEKIVTWVNQSLMTFELAFDLWRGVLMCDSCTPGYKQLLSREFWEELNYGWYAEYIYPYDDPYGIKMVSPERKLRINHDKG